MEVASKNLVKDILYATGALYLLVQHHLGCKISVKLETNNDMLCSRQQEGWSFTSDVGMGLHYMRHSVRHVF